MEIVTWEIAEFSAILKFSSDNDGHSKSWFIAQDLVLNYTLDFTLSGFYISIFVFK